MVNTSYKKGYTQELNAKKELEEQGYTVIRSSGSHGAFDLVAFDFNHFRLIQVKAKKVFSRKEREIEIKKLGEYSKKVPHNARIELWIKLKTGFTKVVVE